MLQNLRVKNLALIDEAEVDFQRGLNILTGETGAGKSIIIGSINLALGGKVQKEMLREGADYALVELIFDVTEKRQEEKLRQLEVFPEDGLVILSRKIVGGRGVARVNGESVPASKLKEIADILIDIHGQQEHQSLLSKKKHLEILDEYAREELEPLKNRLAEKYHTYRKLCEELNEADVGEAERARELSLLEYEVNEISEAELKIGEDEEIEADFKKYSNGRKILEAVGTAHESLSGGTESASELTGRALKELSTVASYDEALATMENELLEIDNLLNDLNREMADYLEETDFDEETFYQMEKRLDEINHLKSKYGDTIPDILQALEEKQARMEKLSDYDGYLERLRAQVKASEQELEEISQKVSKIRQKYAKKLTASIKEALQDLNFLDVQFTMQFERTADYTANGIDDAEFLISTNPGEPVKPLGKVASGGELSRIMLAVKTVLPDHDAVDTLIFDEIDTGISGRTAQMVSEKMNVLAKKHQIISITHLPQIAAMADAHYLIQKSVQNQSTVSTIRRLDEKESVEELARMLGGVEITETVRENAREMKVLAAEKKEP